MILAAELEVMIGKKVLAIDGSLAEKSFRIKASPEVMARFEKFLAYVQHCAGVGHSTTVGFDIDGDGPEQFRVVEKLPKVVERAVRRHTHGFEMHN